MLVLIYHFIMKMRSRRPAGISALSYALTPLYLHALGNTYRFEMGIPCLITESMIYENRVAITEELESDRLHHTVTRRVDRISRLEGEVDTAMLFRAAGKRILSETETAGQTVNLTVRNHRRNRRNT